MTTWIIISWVVVALLTIGNILFFLKLKKTSEQMIQSAFPGARNMDEAMAQMQKMMQARRPAHPMMMGGRKGKGKRSRVQKADSQLNAALAMLNQAKKK